MTKVCVICWNEVTPDGAGFYCKNDNHLLHKDQINWLGPKLVFDTDKADVMEYER